MIDMSQQNQTKETKEVYKRQVPCSLCGCLKYTVMYDDELGDQAATLDYKFTSETRKTYQIVRCPLCGLIYTNPMPCLSEHYSDTVDEVYLASKDERLATAKKLIKQIRKIKSEGRLLDIGCATGFLLDVASEFFGVEGIELSKWAHERAAQRHRVYNHPLREIDLKNSFDVVTLLGVIEHFEKPLEEIKAISKIMKPGGIIVIYTGNVDAWLPKILGKKWWWFQGMHVHFFSKKTCEALLNKVGISVVSVKTHTVFFSLFSLANSFNRYKFGRKILSPIFNLSVLRNVMIPLRLSGEMLMFAEKRQV